jgi:peptidoglycan hydrolase CwlO-like protein
MKVKYIWLIFTIAALLSGCESVKKEDFERLRARVYDLENSVSNLKRATATDLSKLNANDFEIASRIQRHDSQIESIRRKTDTICIITRNGKWEEFRQAGDTKCTIQ